MKDLDWYKESINYYIEKLSNFSDSKVRSREYKEGGYGRFYFKEKITSGINSENKDFDDIQLELWFKQKNYKDHCIIRKKYRVDNHEYLKEFYAQFLEEIILCTACMRTNEVLYSSDNNPIHCYSFADLINKGLPDKDKIDG